MGASAALASLGAHVTICGRTASDVAKAVSAIRSAGGHAVPLELDILDFPHVQRVLHEGPPFEILVSNAGTNRPKSLVESTPDDFDAVFNLNVKAAYFLAREFARRLIEVGAAGSLIHISSQLGHVGAPDRSLYVASKFALEGLTKALAIELGHHKIRVNSISPTFTDTQLTRSYGLDASAIDAIKSRIKLGRIGRVEDVMGAIAYLASDASSLVTGASILVDGGWTAD